MQTQHKNTAENQLLALQADKAYKEGFIGEEKSNQLISDLLNAY